LVLISFNNINKKLAFVMLMKCVFREVFGIQYYLRVTYLVLISFNNINKKLAFVMLLKCVFREVKVKVKVKVSFPTTIYTDTEDYTVSHCIVWFL
jgi:hypothetical protein